MSRNAPMIPHTVPKRPTKGAAAAVVPRNGMLASSVVSSALAARPSATQVEELAEDDRPARERGGDEEREHRGDHGARVGDHLQVVQVLRRTQRFSSLADRFYPLASGPCPSHGDIPVSTREGVKRLLPAGLFRPRERMRTARVLAPSKRKHAPRRLVAQ